MGKRKPECPRGVKYFECVPEGELKQNKVVRSILASTFVNEEYEFVFCVDGELVSRKYSNILVQKKDVVVSCPYNRLVTIHRNDGSTEYGFLGFDYRDIVVGKELTSIYIHKIRNPNTGTWEWPGTLYGERAPGGKLGKLFPYYNENMESAVETRDAAKVRLPVGDMGDYRCIYSLTHYENDWVTKCVQGVMPEIDPELGVRFVANKYRFRCPPEGFDRWSGLPPQFYTFKKAHYLKSVYKKVTNRKLVKELFPLEDLVMIREVEPSRSEGGNVEQKVVWTSLDETCKGNV